MGARISLLGQRFGRLVVIADTRPACLCRCDCGVERLVARNKLPNGRQKSCGCQHGAAIRALKREYCVGVKAYRLTCIDNLKTGVLRLWHCECGNTVMASPKDVRGGNTKSCGCLKRETASKMGARTCGRNTKGASQTRWKVVHLGKPLQLRSGFELIYFRHLVAQHIAFAYEPKTFVLDDEMRYTPDFYLPDTHEWVEVKGHLTERGKAKHAAFRAQGHKLTLVREQDIRALLPAGVTLGAFYLQHARA